MNEKKNLNFKIPKESIDYEECSKFIIRQIESIIKETMQNNQNKIIINTNLKKGLPMENINKVAGPFIEAWAYEKFADKLEDKNNKYNLINVEAGQRLNMADVILQFERKRKNQNSITGYVDIKATSKDIPNSGKSPNITSFARIRTEYLKDPDYTFIILSIKHSVYNKRDENSQIMLGVMEVIDFNAYDLKYLGSSDLDYNPSLGTGQIQIRDIHYVTTQIRTTWEFCQLLDDKCIASKKGYKGWLKYAKQYNWIKDEE